jgi:HEAT repeat protein
MPATVVPSVTDEDAALRERLRIDTCRQLHAHGDVGVDTLASALRDPDTNMRRNAAAMLNVLAGGWMVQTGLQKRPVVRAVPALVQALDDPDPGVRFMAATTIRDSGEDGAPAVPTLIRMITRGDRPDRIRLASNLQTR